MVDISLAPCLCAFEAGWSPGCLYTLGSLKPHLPVRFVCISVELWQPVLDALESTTSEVGFKVGCAACSVIWP